MSYSCHECGDDPLPTPKPPKKDRLQRLDTLLDVIGKILLYLGVPSLLIVLHLNGYSIIPKTIDVGSVTLDIEKQSEVEPVEAIAVDSSTYELDSIPDLKADSAFTKVDTVQCIENPVEHPKQ